MNLYNTKKHELYQYYLRWGYFFFPNALNQVLKEFETVWSEMVVPLMASRILETWGAVSTSPEPRHGQYPSRRA